MTKSKGKGALQDIRPTLDEHDDANRRQWLTVQTVNGVCAQTAVTGEQFYRFHNYGRMVTAVLVTAPTDNAVSAVVRALDPDNDMVAEVSPGQTVVVGPFPPQQFNRLDQSIWLDVDATAAVSVVRLGV